jgi:hypothetical protein
MNPSKNKYYKQSHIPERKFRELLRCFALDLKRIQRNSEHNVSGVKSEEME